MKRYQHSKSGLFLIELLVNLLLFCFLCGYGLMFFIKSNNLIEDSTTLYNAVHLSSSVAGIYENGDGSFLSLCETFPNARQVGDTLYIYLDEDYTPCGEEASVYYISARKETSALSKLLIDFYDDNGKKAYSIRACNYASSTLSTAKEVANP